MNIFHLVKVRFDRRRADITQEWLDNRYRFFVRYTLRSLLEQTTKDWVLWINCDAGMRGMVAELRHLLVDMGVQALWSFGDESPCPADLPTTVQFGQLARADYVYVTRIDSDDLYANDALELVQGVIPKVPGEVEASIFRRGYMHELPGVSCNQGRVGVYYNPSSPFHTIMYPRDVFIDPELYSQVWNKIGDHSRVESSLYSHPLPHFKFCVLVHGHNFLSTFDYAREDKGPNSWVEKGWTLKRFLQQPVVFDVDDFCEVMGGISGYQVLEQLDSLRANYPNFKCTLFTIPQRTSKTLLYRASRKDYIEIAPHGINHVPNLELKTLSPGKLREGLQALDYSIYRKGFRPPGWYIAREHIEALNQLGMWVGLNYRDAPKLGPLCQHGYYVCGDRLPYWHGHTHNVCGNWLQEHLNSLLAKWPAYQAFSHVSDSVLVSPS